MTTARVPHPSLHSENKAREIQLSPSQIDEFYEIGYLIIPSVFTAEEIAEMRLALNRLQALRDEWDKPIKLSSAFRSSSHPRERLKQNGPGYHHGINGNGGMAFDCLIAGEDVVPFIALAIKHGFRGIGVNQKGEWNQRFIHIDTRDKYACWSY